jgi:hypothetical protein
MLNKEIKQTCWHDSDSDWSIIVDADELIYFPAGAECSLSSYAQQSLPVAKPYGYEMHSDALPGGSGQIYDEIKNGARDDKWYAKPVLINVGLVKQIEFSTGAHTCTGILKSGGRFANPQLPVSPPCYLLHFHHIGGLDRIAAKYDATKARYSELNKRHNWGWQGDGMVHAKDKRTAILASLERVVA